MRSFRDLSLITQLNGILQKHDRKVIDDGRTFAVIHKPTGSVSRHGSIDAVIQSLEPIDERLTQFLKPCV